MTCSARNIRHNLKHGLLLWLSAVCLAVAHAQTVGGGQQGTGSAGGPDDIPVGFEQRTNLPTLYINTLDGRAVNSKTAYKDAVLFTSAPSSLKGRYCDTLQIRGRGNSTWGPPKSAYRIKLREKTHYLGMTAKRKKWNLLANYFDKSLLRNAVGMMCSRLTGCDFTPEGRFADLVLNGDFLGCYYVMDQVEIGKNRVELDELTPGDTDPDAITGGYLLEVDGFANMNVQEGSPFPEAFFSAYGTPVTIKSPEDDEITAAQRDYIIQHYNAYERAVQTYIPGGSETGVLRYVDADDFIRWYIATELTSNPDCLWSTYLRKPRGRTQFSFGPLWDEDIAFANDYRLGDLRRDYILPHAHAVGVSRSTCEKLLWLPSINQGVRRQWEQMGGGERVRRELLHGIDSLNSLLARSARLNFERFPILSQKLHYNIAALGSWQAEVDFLRGYVIDHVAWADSIFSHFDEIFAVPHVEEGRWYLLANAANDMVLEPCNDGIGSKCMIWDNLGGERPTQLFRFEPCTDSEGYYYVVNKANGFVLDCCNRCTGSQSDLNLSPRQAGSATQLWRIQFTTNQTIQLINCMTGQTLDNYNDRAQNGNEVGMFNNHGGTNQQWQLIPWTDPDGIHSDARGTNSGQADAQPRIWTTRGQIHIALTSPARIQIYTLHGYLIATTNAPVTQLRQAVAPGQYIVRIGQASRLVVVR